MPTKIEWADETWNPIRGTIGRWHCTKVSEGCRNCYAERMNIRFGGRAYVKGADTLRLDEKVLEQPLHWRKPRMVFVCSMTDLFHMGVKEDWIARMFEVMGQAKHHTFQILTKRAHCLPRFSPFFSLLSNVWLGVSVEDQATFDDRARLLIETSAALRFISYEPALGPLDAALMAPTGKFRTHGGRRQVQMKSAGIDWVICGGESGPQARPMAPEWARSLRNQCRIAGVPFLFKQWGAWLPSGQDDARGYRQVTDVGYLHLGKKKAGHLLDGKEHMEFPALECKE